MILDRQASEWHAETWRSNERGQIDRMRSTESETPIFTEQVHRHNARLSGRGPILTDTFPRCGSDPSIVCAGPHGCDFPRCRDDQLSRLTLLTDPAAVVACTCTREGPAGAVWPPGFHRPGCPASIAGAR